MITLYSVCLLDVDAHVHRRTTEIALNSDQLTNQILALIRKMFPSLQRCSLPSLHRLFQGYHHSQVFMQSRQFCAHHINRHLSNTNQLTVNASTRQRISVIQWTGQHAQTCKAHHFSTSAAQEQQQQHPIVLVTEDEGPLSGVRRVTLNNPKKRNALSLGMIEQLAQHLQQDPEGKLRAIVINANHGGKVFSSGHDLKEMATLNSEQSRHIFERCSDLMLTIRASPVPVICQVDGLAAAAGCQLAASCDIVLATEHSTFSTPGADVGLFCSTPGIAVSRSANLKMAAYMVLTGRSITANEALVAGLITRVVQNDSELQSETDAVLQSILAKSRSVIALGKKFFYRQIELDLPTAYSQGSCTMVDNLQLKDGQEGIKAFIGKRKPAWSHSSE